MKKIVLYMHSGSKNHGCEAIARTIRNNIPEENKVELCSNKKQEDIEFGLNSIFDNIIDRKNIGRYSFSNITAKLTSIITKNKNFYYKKLYGEFLENIHKGDLAISIGGDTYCYDGLPQMLRYLNQKINDKKAKTALIGCSIEPSKLKNKELVEDLKKYSLICTRESITYQALKAAGIDKNTKLIPDSAFTLETALVTLPENFIEGKTIGLNVSPLIQNLENGKNITYKNYVELIRYILEKTEDNIALIPHVLWKDNNDLEPLTQLYNEFKHTNRVVLIQEENCMKLKGYIAKCKIFVGARTHATIAAYSSKVPTLVVGYSVKAKGIAKDIFGTYDNYVLPVQELKQPEDLTKAFNWIVEHEKEIQQILEKQMPEYIQKVELLKGEITNLLGEVNEE